MTDEINKKNPINPLGGGDDFCGIKNVNPLGFGDVVIGMTHKKQIKSLRTSKIGNALKNNIRHK
ncbi:MAG: hypothetical protein J5534_15450 [Fibrobacter sp.]|nr:hypothetical protein [Fibrobacter sp.]